MDFSSKGIRSLLLWLPVLCGLAVLGQQISIVSLGFDFTDEGYYLQEISNPSAYGPSLSQFGFIYHPFYIFTGSEVAALRLSNIIMLFGAAWLSIYLFLAALFPREGIRRIDCLALSFGLASCSLMYFNLGLVTPSYNSLNLQAIFLALAGLFAIHGGGGREALIGSMLVGAGGWLVFMAKPSSAALLAVSVSAIFLIERKFTATHYVLAFATAAVLLTLAALAIDGSIGGFANRILQGLQLSALNESGHSIKEIFRIDELQLTHNMKLQIAMLTCAAVLLGYLTYSSGNYAKIISISCIGLFGISILYVTGRGVNWTSDQAANPSLLFIGLPLGSLLLISFLLGSRKEECRASPHLTFGALLLVTPYIYAFGTNGNYWQAAADAGLFWLLAVIALLAGFTSPTKAFLQAVSYTLFAQLLTAGILQYSMQYPYRQPEPLRGNTHGVTLGKRGVSLTLSEGYARYIIEAQQVTADAGFTRKSYILDLTGQSPGLLFSLGALGVEQAWTIGGYAGSENRTKASLVNANCQTLADSWLLVEPEGPRSLSTNILTTFGSDLDHDYRLVGSWQTARGAGGYEQQRMQNLYKPFHPEVVKRSCEALQKAIP